MSKDSGLIVPRGAVPNKDVCPFLSASLIGGNPALGQIEVQLIPTPCIKQQCALWAGGKRNYCSLRQTAPEDGEAGSDLPNSESKVEG